VASHYETLIFKLLGDISWAGARNLNPGLGEDGTGNKHVDNVDRGVDRVQESFGEVQRRRHVVCETRDSEKLLRSFLGLPDSKKLNQKVLGEARVEHLADQENVGGECGLQHDGHVGGVEKTDRVGTSGATLAGRFDRNFNAESLEVDDGCEYNEGCEEVHDVGEILSIESLLESTLLVWPGEEEVEERNHRAFEFWPTASVNGGGGERFPDN